MFKLTYDVYYMTRMLKDKVIGGAYDYYMDEEYRSVERMDPHVGGIVNNIYNLTYKPSHIVDNIYLGNAYNASNYPELIENSFGMILNITCEIPNYYDNEFTYYNIQIKDHNDNHVLPHIDAALEFINKYQKNNPDKNILIHCFMGSSRSASIVAAYYSQKYNKTMEESISFIKDKRSIVNINTTFVKDLKEWYKNNN